MRKLSKRNDFNVVINLCDGVPDEGKAGLDVVEALEKFKLPFTGGNLAFFSLSKQEIKYLLGYSGVPQPQYFFATTAEDIFMNKKYYNYPLIVKHPNGCSSIGLTEKSVVYNYEELYKQASYMNRKYGGSLIEQFIEGREFTVLVIENPDDPKNPFVPTPLEITFSGSCTFRTFDAVWIDYKKSLSHKMLENEIVLEAKLKQIAS